MKNQLIITLLLLFVWSTACRSKKETMLHPKSDTEAIAGKKNTLPFVIAQNYFVKNTVEAIENLKIDTEAAFKSYFGAATTMGNNGKPTAVNFTKEFAIAIVLPNTNVTTTIQPVALKQTQDHSLLFEYKVTVGEKQSYTSRPFLLVLVDKKFVGNVSLKQVN